jgi:hypothetical protein
VIDLDERISKKTFITTACFMCYSTEGFGKMRLKAVSGIVLTVFLLGTLILTFNVQLVATDGTVDWWQCFTMT